MSPSTLAAGSGVPELFQLLVGPLLMQPTRENAALLSHGLFMVQVGIVPTHADVSWAEQKLGAKLKPACLFFVIVLSCVGAKAESATGHKSTMRLPSHWLQLPR